MRDVATEVPAEELILQGRSRWNLGSLFFMLSAAIVAHFEFSWMGFSPTDEGWILAYSRRILAGQVPNRDYIRVQVPGTEILHAPEVLFGGDYTFWISRLVAWLQIAVIAWAWPLILAKLARRDIPWFLKSVLGLICIAFTACTFPVIVWPTYDGLFFISIGLLLVLQPRPSSRVFGYFLIGLAYVCKQNFVVVFPLVLVILDDWRQIRNWIAASLPGAIYLGSLWALGAIPDFLIQVGSATPFFERAILPVLTQWNELLGVVLGLVSAFLMVRKKPQGSLAGSFIVFAILTLCGWALATELYWYSNVVSWFLFGVTLGVTLVERFLPGGDKNAGVAGLAGVIVVWSTAISNGFNFPTLGCGVLVLFLVQSVLMKPGRAAKYFCGSPAVIFLMIVSVASLWVGRHRHIYRDLAANKLTAPLDDVLPGGRLLYTNQNTRDFLADLNTAIGKTQGARFAIIPGFPAYWVKGAELDPIPLDWPYMEVLSNPKMIDRLVNSVAAQKGHIVLLVEKVEPTDLKSGFEPLDEPIYPVALLSYVRTHFKKVGETKYFELRE